MKKLILYCALGLMVSGLAFGSIHDVEHAQGDHTELCGVFKSAAQCGLVETQSQLYHVFCVAQPSQSYSTDTVICYAGMNWSGRAPPL
jgi:hypothetical protein